MRIGYVVVAALAACVTVFVLQNTDVTTVRFLIWGRDGVPLAPLLVGILAAGLVIAGLPLWIRLSVWRSRARHLGTRVSMLESAVEERDRQVLRMPPRSERPTPP